jgi:hypothetical protein
VFVVCVFGGNDFDELLHLKRAFEGRGAPPGHGPMRERIERAAEHWRGAVYQGLIAATYFAEHPSMRGEAVQDMSAGSREILELCRAARIAAVFVYLPPLHDVAWSRHAKRLDAAAEALGLPREQRHVLDELADGYVGELRTIGANVLDLRAVFRASSEELYWQADAHINLAAHALIAAELTPIVSTLAPQRSEHAGSRGERVQESSRMPSWLDAFSNIAEEPLPELKLERSAVARLVPLGDELEFDVERLFRASHWTIPGDAHATTLFLGDEFLWDSEETRLASDIETELRARTAIDASGVRVNLTPGGGIHTALLVARAESTPEVKRVVVAVNLGNDLLDAVRLERLGRKQERGESNTRAPLEVEAAWCDSVAYFRAHPRRLDDALRSLARGTLALAQECGERGQQLLVVMIPAAFESATDPVQARIDADATRMGFEFEDFERLRRAAKAYGRFMESGLELFRVDPETIHAGVHDVEHYRASATARRAVAARVAVWLLAK